MTVTMYDLFGQGQIRLSELSVFNWGSFHGLHTASIDPQGTLITGDNGSGKSTLIDGLMALLLPAGKAAFNVAAAHGDRSDRSLISYMRGSFGSAHDGSSTRIKSKREKSVVTGLRAFYTADDGSCITLAAMFWTTQSTNALSDVKRIYIIAKRNLQLKEVLEPFGEGNVRHLKQWLKDDPTITCCDDNFSDYQELYRKLLQMENKNAPALLCRALGLKKIDDLTKLIRELVLEPSTVKDDAKRVVDEFADLVAIHNQLIDAKEQVAHLQRLPAIAETISQTKITLDSLKLQKQNLSIYFGELFAALWSDKIKEISASLDALNRALQHTEILEQDAAKSVELRHEEYLNLGGDKIESIKNDLAHIKSKLNDVAYTASRYQEDCKTLCLNNDLNNAQFDDNQKRAIAMQDSIEEDTKQSQDNFGEMAALLTHSQKKLTGIVDEIKEIEARPDSNIDINYQRLRDDIVKSLQIPADKLMFIGELIDVAENEKHWQGAIERALGGLRTTLLVPQKNYAMVTRWLNVKHTGLHVRLQVVQNDAQHTTLPVFKDNGFLKKLQWREHPYREWLKAHINKFDLQCVASADALNTTPFSMTQQGLMHLEHGRFEKKDQHRVDDRRKWCLGFSNKSRLALLNTDKRETEAHLHELSAKLTQARTALNDITERAKIWERIQSYAWDGINAPYWQQRLENVQTDLKKLEASGSNLQQAKARWEDAKVALKSIQDQKSQLLLQKGSLDRALENANSALRKSQVLAAPGLAHEVRPLLEKRVGIVTLEDTHKQAEVEKVLDAELEKMHHKKSSAENSANGIMASFRGKDKWQPITADWPTGLDGLPDYLMHFDHLEKEGLPKLVDQFTERLNKHTTQSLAQIKTKLESEREDILERIETINRVLRKTEFKQGSHLRLGSKREKYPHTHTFDSKLKQALGQATSDDHESRFNLLVEIVEVLEKASAPGTVYNLESLRLLDPRYQMSFYAEEIDSETNTVRDVLESSSGKSGGEKESFAGTIVAASLAYVLTPDGCDKPIYSTIFLDEAFSNTAETVSKRVLKVFKALHLHANLITPYKNLNLAREYARSLLIAERDPHLHESQLCEVTWEEIDRRIAAMHETAAKALGVEVHE